MSAGEFRRFLDSCYSRPATVAEWMGGLLASVAPVVAPREGVFVNTAHAPRGGPARILESTASGRAARFLEIPLAEAPPGIMERSYEPFLVTTLSRRLGVRSVQELPFFCDTWGAAGVREVIGLMARDGRRSLVVGIPLLGGEARSHREPILHRVRRHLQAGLLGLGRRSPAGMEVVADSDGRLLHSGDAGFAPELRELVRAAAQAFDRERRGALADADAERVWRDLWRGGWALVESMDSDGKRLLVLRRDPSGALPRPDGLDAHEKRALHRLAQGATYKQVAFDLGVAVSTASFVVTKALRKLGFRDRVDFIRHLGTPATGSLRRT